MSDLIDGHVAHLRAAGQTAKSIRDRTKLLRRLARELPFGLEVVGTEDLESWLGQFGPGWTLYTYSKHIRGFYCWAASTPGGLTFDPAAALPRIRAPKCRPRPLSDAQVAVALQLPRPWRTAIILALYGGLRVGAVARLYREHVGRDEMVVHRKGGDTYMVQTHPAIWAEVRSLGCGPVVPLRRGGRFQPDDLSARLSDRLAGAGLPGVTLHRFRHTFGTRLLAETGNLRLVQEALGHEDISSTQIYTEVEKGQLRLAIQKLAFPASTQVEAA